MSTSIVPEAVATAAAAAATAVSAAASAAWKAGSPASTGTPSAVLKMETLVIGGKTYYERPADFTKSACENTLGCCCYSPELVTFYANAATTIQVGEKDGTKCCCCTAPPKPPKGELHAGYQVVGKGTLSPWKMPCCFCLQQTPSMIDPSNNKDKTFYVPTAIVKDNAGNPVYEMRIRSTNLNICGSCQSCCKMECCKPKCCGLACASCCGPCCNGCNFCSSCCKCKACFGCCGPCCSGCCGPCKPFCEMSCPACYGCIFSKKGQEPTYIVENQPIFKPGKNNITPVGYIKSVRLGNEPIMITIDVPDANEEEQALLLILAYALDPTR